MAASAPPQPPTHVDLSGQYELDKGASDGISPFLKEAGYSWATRQVCAAAAAGGRWCGNCSPPHPASWPTRLR